MKKFIFGIVGLFLLLLIAAVVIPFLVPQEVYKSAIEERLTAELDRKVLIDGDISVSPFPVLKAKAGRVTIENPEGFSGDYFAAMNAMDTRVKLMPLLSKRVEIAAFTLVDPEIRLEKLKDGSVNWAFGDDKAPAEPAETGPFKRDGRYADLDPSIGKFTLQNGTISYRDDATGNNHLLSDVDVTFEMPSLNKPVSIDGDLIANGISMDMDLTVDTPRSFLDGKKTPVDINLQTDFGDLKAKGYFKESQDILFNLDVGSTIRDLLPITDYLPDNLPIKGVISTIDFSGNYDFDGKTVIAKGADISVTGPEITSKFKGDATLSDKPVASGNLELVLSNIPELARKTGQTLPAADLLTSASINTNLKAAGTGFTAENLSAVLKGDGLDTTFNGAGSFDGKPAASGNFTANIASVPNLVRALNLDAPQAAALGNAKASGTLTLEGSNVTMDIKESRTEGPNINAGYRGQLIKTGDTISLAGTFDSLVPSVPDLAKAAQTELPYAQALETVKTTGAISGSPGDLKISDLDVELSGGQVAGRFTGNAELGETVNLSGAFDSLVPSLPALATAAGQELPYSASIETVKAKGNISGNPGNLQISDMDIQLSGGQVNGRFTGSAIVKDGFNLNGYLDAEIPSARTLAAANGTQLPASTQAGEIYERVSLKGNITGTPAEIKFTEADISLDALKGDGGFTVDMTGPKPTILSDLDMGQIDLRPYMAAYMAQNQGKGIQPWSNEPYNFAALRAMNGTYTVKTPEILFGNLKMGQTDVKAEVSGGVMTARLPQINLYGGLGVMTATLDASGDIPKVKMDVRLEDITTNRFLASMANYTLIEGEGHTLLEITGEGRSQAEIMKSLNGYGDFKVLNGVLSGIDLSQFLTGVDDVLTSRAIPKGLGKSYSTKFNDVAGLFKIKNGVVSIDEFNLNALGAAASGSGELDIGNQAMDFRFRPRLTGSNASDLASFGIPLKFAGAWGQASAGLDTEFMTKIAAEKAKLKAKQELTNRVGGDLGNVLGSVLGVGGNDAPAAPAPEPAETTDTPAEPAEPKAVTTPESAVTDIVGGVLGIGPKKEEPAEPVAEPAAPEEAAQDEAPKQAEDPKPEEKKDPAEQLLEDALGGLFKKKKDGGN